MSIIDIQIVLAEGEALRNGLAQDLADCLGLVLHTQPGQLWLRLHALPCSNYAENGATLAPSELPIFVTVLHARRPESEALRAQALALTQAVASVVARDQTQVHVAYAPSGAGRMAFGGNLVG